MRVRSSQNVGEKEHRNHKRERTLVNLRYIFSGGEHDGAVCRLAPRRQGGPEGSDGGTGIGSLRAVRGCSAAGAPVRAALHAPAAPDVAQDDVATTQPDSDIDSSGHAVVEDAMGHARDGFDAENSQRCGRNTL